MGVHQVVEVLSQQRADANFLLTPRKTDEVESGLYTRSTHFRWITVAARTLSA